MSIVLPQPSGGFEWVQEPALSERSGSKGPRILRCAPLARHAHHFYTTGSMQLRESDEEWRDVAAVAGVATERLRLLRQVHGRTVVAADRASGGEWSRPEADAVTSDDPSVALVVRVADCAPILLADTRTGAVAAVHAGWRSTMQRIVRAALDAMRQRYQTEPADIIAAIGPSLGTCCGEMGEEVVDAFRRAGHSDDDLGRWFVRAQGTRPHFDLWGANRDQLEARGVPPDAIHVAGLCTRTYPDVFHSYRAAGSAAGRMAAVIRAGVP